MFRDKLADGGDKVMGDLHYGVVVCFECRLILGHGFFLRLLLIVREDAPNSVFVPSGGNLLWLISVSYACVSDKKVTMNRQAGADVSCRTENDVKKL